MEVRHSMPFLGNVVSLCTLAVLVMMPTGAQQKPTTASPPADTKSAGGSPVLLGKDAPAFVVATLDGAHVSLADYRGKTVLVNFWATWCGNCKLEMPWLAQLREKYASQGFEVLGILTNNASPERVERLREQSGVKYPLLICNHATAKAYGGLPDLPESFFIDRSGRVVAEMDGADSEEEIEANILKALHDGEPH